ncbi:MAG TPA: hypothetical protein VE574_00735 [Nitrososphaeraceae archaeon]|nr:hypothetical protein [Nitrososphaeraceae archaeon]
MQLSRSGGYNQKLRESMTTLTKKSATSRGMWTIASGSIQHYRLLKRSLTYGTGNR